MTSAARQAIPRWPIYVGFSFGLDVQRCVGCGTATIVPMSNGISLANHLARLRAEGWIELPWLAVEGRLLCPSCAEHVVTEYTERRQAWLRYDVRQKQHAERTETPA